MPNVALAGWPSEARFPPPKVAGDTPSSCLKPHRFLPAKGSAGADWGTPVLDGTVGDASRAGTVAAEVLGGLVGEESSGRPCCGTGGGGVVD